MKRQQRRAFIEDSRYRKRHKTMNNEQLRNMESRPRSKRVPCVLLQRTDPDAVWIKNYKVMTLMDPFLRLVLDSGYLIVGGFVGTEKVSYEI